MPAFPKPLAVSVPEFVVRVSVFDGSPAPTVSIEFAAYPVAADGTAHQVLTGDLTPYLTPAQVTNFTNAALALYAKAKADLIG